MLTFCTLFNSVYLSRGLAMYNSLEKYCNNFHLYIFTFDSESFNCLKSLNLQYATIISLEEFEDEELLRVKPTRSKGEYFWTCTSSTILYVLNNYSVDHCTYVDSDLYFFSSPQLLLDEMGDHSILLTPHHYTKKYDQSEKTGIYCVQFLTFRKNEKGLKALTWWRKSCIEWCFNRFENGKFGDQKYLDDWPERFEGVHVCENLGAGIAPWNMQQYKFANENNRITGTEIATGKKFDIIFFHFHSLMFVSQAYFSPRPYYMRNDTVISLLFNPYAKEICRIREENAEIKNMEVYLSGFNKMKYFIELLLRRGFKEIHYKQLLHK